MQETGEAFMDQFHGRYGNPDRVSDNERSRERRKRKNAVLLMLRYRQYTRNCPTGVWIWITEKKNFTSCRMRS